MLTDYFKTFTETSHRTCGLKIDFWNFSPPQKSDINFFTFILPPVINIVQHTRPKNRWQTVHTCSFQQLTPVQEFRVAGCVGRHDKSSKLWIF